MATPLFGTDGVRGVAGREPITAASAVRLGMAAAEVLGAKATGAGERPQVVIGRDTRASGECLEHAVAAGLTAVGVDVLMAGIIPTPAVAHLTAVEGAAFGVVISASHNPFEDNGIKFFSGAGTKLADAEEGAIGAAFQNGAARLELSTGRGVGRIRPLPDATARYARYAASTVTESARTALAGRRLAVDCAHGAAFASTPEALRLLGLEARVLNAAPDGYNINAGCGSTHPEALAGALREMPGTLGFAHDGDADRVLFCDEEGVPVDGDEILTIAARDLLQRGALRRRTVAVTVMSNYGLESALASAGGSVVRTGVGDRQIIEAMLGQDLNLGGEQSGHFIFRDHAPTGDGLVAALQILAIVALTGQPLRELRRALRKYPQVQRSVVVRDKPPLDDLPEVQAILAETEQVLHGRGRVLLRYSGTEPKARLLLEGPEEADLVRLADRLEGVLRATLGA